MIKVLLITNDEGLQRFCEKLHGHHIFMMYVSPFNNELRDFYGQASVILLDFEVIKQGYNDIPERLTVNGMELPMLPLVQETSMSSAMRLLKCDYEDMVLLPCCVEYLQSYILKCAVEQRSTILDVSKNDLVENFVGNSPQMLLFKRKLLLVAQSDLAVLILGETGTGKSFIARILHQLSARWENNFVEENIAAIQETLVEGELFGTKLGAYTGAISRIGLFEHANKGTLFLDEIACVDKSIQAKLLQVLETGVYRPVGSVEKKKADVRLICATNVPLGVLKSSDIFRLDLYYRISAVQLHIPPLRSRKEDIHLLAKYFLNNIALKTGQNKRFSPTAIAKLESHDWPGNVRELERCVESAYFLTSKIVITGRDINFIS